MPTLSKEECLSKIKTDKNLWNELRVQYPEWIPDLDEMDFETVDLFDINLKNCSLVRANFENTKNLQEKQLGGSNLNGAKLPENFEFKGLKTVEELSKNSSVLFITLIAACLYCWLTIFSTDNLALLTNSTNSQLPIINVSISIKWFYRFAPWLLISFYLYFHFYLKNLWKELSELPAYFPDGKSLDQKAYSWLMIDFITGFMCILKDKNTHFKNFQGFITVFLGWCFVPITIIGIWGRFLVEHAIVSSLFQATCAIIAIYFAFSFYRLAEDTLGCVVNKDLEKIYRKIYIGIGSLLILISIIHPYYPLYYYEFYDQTEIVKKPENWDEISNNLDKIDYSDGKWREKFDQILSPVKIANFSNKNLKRIDAIGAFLVKADLHKINLQGADLRKAMLQNAQLKNSNMQWVYLQGTNLQRVNLSSANLKGSYLGNSNLQGGYLYKANLQGVNLREANLQGAYLGEANLQGANLVSTNLQGIYWAKANLQGANLCGVDLALTKNLTFDMLKEAVLDKNTVLPDYLKNRKAELLKISKINFNKLKASENKPSWVESANPEF